MKAKAGIHLIWESRKRNIIEFASLLPSVFSPCLRPKIVSMEGAWIITSVFPIRCPLISAWGENLTKDDPVISQVQYSETV